MRMQQADIVLRGGLIVDGTGQPRFLGGVAVTGGLTASASRFDGTAMREIDAPGPPRFVCAMPGGPERCVRSPTGAAAVILNGRIAVQNGTYTDARAGVII